MVHFSGMSFIAIVMMCKKKKLQLYEGRILPLNSPGVEAA